MATESQKYSQNQDSIYAKLKEELRAANIQLEDSIGTNLQPEDQPQNPFSYNSSPGSRDTHKFPVHSKHDFVQVNKSTLPQPVYTALYQDALIRAERKKLIEQTVIYNQGCTRC
jgi:hypothetical protein